MGAAWVGVAHAQVLTSTRASPRAGVARLISAQAATPARPALSCSSPEVLVTLPAVPVWAYPPLFPCSLPVTPCLPLGVVLAGFVLPQPWTDLSSRDPRGESSWGEVC